MWVFRIAKKRRLRGKENKKTSHGAVGATPCSSKSKRVQTTQAFFSFAL